MAYYTKKKSLKIRLYSSLVLTQFSVMYVVQDQRQLRSGLYHIRSHGIRKTTSVQKNVDILVIAIPTAFSVKLRTYFLQCSRSELYGHVRPKSYSESRTF